MMTSVPTWIWIVIAVIVVLAVVFAVGLVLAKRRRVSLTPGETSTAEKPVVPQRPQGGGYKAGGSISFSDGGGSGTATLDRPPATPDRIPATPSAPAPGCARACASERFPAPATSRRLARHQAATGCMRRQLFSLSVAASLGSRATGR